MTSNKLCRPFLVLTYLIILNPIPSCALRMNYRQQKSTIEHKKGIDSLDSITSSSKNQTQEIHSLCSNEYVILNMDSSDISYNISFDCYSQIPNYKTIIKAFQINSICYVHPDQMYIHKQNKKISRCGEWLQLTGPSHKIVHCMVVGTINPIYQNVPFKVNKKILTLKKNLFTILTRGMWYINYSFTYATAAVHDYTLNIPPSLYTIERSNNSIIFQIYEVHRPIEYLQAGTILYFKNENDLFVLPSFFNHVHLRAININGDSVTFPKTNFQNFQKNFHISATSFFKNLKMSDCSFQRNNQISDVNDNSTKTPFLMWYFFSVKNNIPHMVNNKNLTFTTISNNSKTSIFIVNPAASLLSQESKEIMFEAKVNFLPVNLRVQTVIIANISKLGSPNAMFVVINNMATKLLYYNNSLYIRAAFDKQNYDFANAIILSYVANSGDILIVLNTKLIPLENNTKNCDNTYDCENTECTVDNTSLDVGTRKWIRGCEPQCGVCRDGFLCNTMGMCQKETNLNFRNAGYIKMVVLLICIVGLFLI
ncbi:hypothetical protein EIN_289540 [Entamoeba invadens IP1]|uniref:ShKT domain-containing protein n=1 Tax=Entamoeba invadens IP1 TaxID=370355 RepID=L7FMQ2_ENTIV|nr:hypothetical protein EIN_289540 [Entamoeba invadens IP1]ELP86682.1 hypothetical protein EIN_289540 [Entamoeba invadens IP1]|eukprot:XP_004186028.1 hypothetical protein EIN_289540 [Entamoeba invadens IP1]